MLSWKRDTEGWAANGYRIRLVAPYRWELLDSSTAEAPILTEDTPLATTRTLTQCKREAELLEAATRLSEIRRRNFGLLILARAGFTFVPSLSPPNDLIAVIVLLTLAVRAIGYLAGSYMARSYVSVHDVFYQ